MKKRVQGEAPRVEPCPQGGQHVLMRPVQKYCDRCRPKKRQQTLERQRAWRERQRAKKYGVAAPVVVTATEPLTTEAPVAEHRVIELAAELGRLASQLVAACSDPQRGMTPDLVDRVVDLGSLAAQVHAAARRLRPGIPPTDELAARRARGSR